MFFRFHADQVNRFIAYKQRLVSSAQSSDLSFLSDIGPIRASPPATPYLSVWARTSHTTHTAVDRLLYEDRSLGRVLAMHSRLHLIPKDDLAAHFAISRHLQGEGVNIDSLLESTQEYLAGVATCQQSICQRLYEVINTKGALTVDELERLIPDLGQTVYYDPLLPELGHSRLSTRLLPAMCASGLLVRVAPRGGWKSQQYRYAVFSSWFSGIDLEMPLDDALKHVIMQYIRAFGPVTAGDISQWLGGFGHREITNVLSSLRPQLVHLQILDSASDYVLLADQLPLLEDAKRHLGVSLLPAKDSLLTAYSDKSRFLPEYYATRVYDQGDEANATVWSDGTIIGTWYMRQQKGEITIRFFEQQDPVTWALVAERARMLGQFLDMKPLDLDMGVDEATLDDDEPLLLATRAGATVSAS